MSSLRERLLAKLRSTYKAVTWWLEPVVRQDSPVARWWAALVRAQQRSGGEWGTDSAHDALPLPLPLLPLLPVLQNQGFKKTNIVWESLYSYTVHGSLSEVLDIIKPSSKYCTCRRTSPNWFPEPDGPSIISKFVEMSLSWDGILEGQF